MNPGEVSGPACAEAWSRSADEVLGELDTNPAVGLHSRDVPARRTRFGSNLLRSAKRQPVLLILAEQFRSIVILLLAAAGTLAIVFADHVEGLAIFIVIAINAFIGFVTEWRAVRSMEALSHLGSAGTVVMRDGVSREIPADQLVPGDIVLFEGGEIVTADIRLLEASKLQADESMLTGESLPVRKATDKLRPDTPVTGRNNIVFKGTAITRGSGKGVVVETGLNTELGRISELVTESRPSQTPLEKRLNALARRLVWVVLALAAAITIAGVLTGRDVTLAIEVGIALAVAAIPEGLPIVATIALARGMWRMAQRNALIARLSAVETLGATTVILTDKTGTLTENRMFVTALRLPDAGITIDNPGQQMAARILQEGHELEPGTAQDLDELLAAAALCSNASVRKLADGSFDSVGDPTEVALLVAGEWRNVGRDDLLARHPEIVELSFDPDTKLMATLHQYESGVLVAVKGAPEAVIPLCTSIRIGDQDRLLTEEDRQRFTRHTDEFGAEGLRTLAVAQKMERDSNCNAYEGLRLLGIVGLEDPPRQGVREAVRRCHDAGILVVMVTGDHAATARNVALELGISDPHSGERQYLDGIADAVQLDDEGSSELDTVRVFSRVSPEQKLDLIDFWQRQGEVVAMTGDGVNDAPALKKADIGVAMGIRGTDVAKEASAMVLQDDEFGTIVEAVNQGRAIYANIRKFVVYLLSCNISEVLVVAIATVAGAPLPLLPLQILFLNLVTDVFPALALGVGEGSPGLMNERPRPAGEPILTRPHWVRIVLHGLVIALAVLAAMAIAFTKLGFDNEQAVTVAFCTLALAQLWHVFNMRSDMRQVFLNEISRNPWIWIAVATCVSLVLMAVYLPLLSGVLELVDPGVEGWTVIVLLSFVPVIVAPAVRAIAPRGLMA